MSEVFISYAHSTARQALGAAGALRALGYSVWLDEDLPAHRTFSREIEQQLAAAKAALVIWSAEATASDWVLSEANRAREAHKLVQLRIDRAPLPMPFDQIQCADLSGWSGEGEHPAWRKVAASVADLVRRTGPSRAVPATVAVAAPTVERRLAVLAFDNLSPDSEMSFFSDGVSEEILETVSRNTDLKVISRASSFSLRGLHKATRHVAAELNVSHVLDGSVRRAGSKVRISAQLVDCASETRIWSERFERDLTDIFALQDEIAAAVAEALKAEFARARPSPNKVDPAAYDLYLHARDAGPGPSAPRIEMFELCVAHAPDFAPGWAWLAFYRANQAIFDRGDLALAPLLESARTAVATAERLDPTLGFARAVRQWLEPWAAFQRRESLLREALRLTPGDPFCLVHMSVLLAEVGQRRESLALAEEARSLDPLLPEVVWRCVAQLDENYDEQTVRIDAMRTKWPAFGSTVTWASYAAANGDWPRYEALQRHAYVQPEQAMPEQSMRQTFRYWDAIRDGDRAYLDELANRLLARVERTGSVPVPALWSVAAAGHADAAYEAVDRASFDEAFALEGHSLFLGSWWPGLIFSRTFSAALIDDPRFLRLCAKLGLVHYWLETGRWPDCADTVPYDFQAEARNVAAEGLARHV